MEQFGNILNQYIRELGIEKPIAKYKALQIWNKVVGEKISRVTEPKSLSNGKMLVKVKNDVWRNELIFYKSDIIQSLNRELGSNMVRDIILL